VWALLAALGFQGVASAQTSVWSATLASRTFAGSIGTSTGCRGTGTQACTNTSNLTDADVIHASSDYEITGLQIAPAGSLRIDFNQNLVSGSVKLVFILGGNAFPFKEAEVKAGRDRTWSDPGINFTAGTAVSVSIVDPHNAAPELSVAARGNTQIDLSWTTPATPRSVASLCSNLPESLRALVRFRSEPAFTFIRLGNDPEFRPLGESFTCVRVVFCEAPPQFLLCPQFSHDRPT